MQADHNSVAQSVIAVLRNDFGARPGDIFQRVALLRQLSKDKNSAEWAVVEAESRGWVKALSSEYIELTRDEIYPLLGVK